MSIQQRLRSEMASSGLWLRSRLPLLPARPGCLSCDSLTLCLGHGLETALPADLTAFATDGGHVCRNIGTCRNIGWLCLRCWRIARALIYYPLGKLVRIAWAFSFAYGHSYIMPRQPMLKRV